MHHNLPPLADIAIAVSTLRLPSVYDYVDDNLAEAMDEMEKELLKVCYVAMVYTCSKF